MLKHTNLTADPKIEEARLRLEQLMEGKDKDMFKDDPQVRETVKKEVDAIIKSYDW
jgi:hypothetical protein